MIYKFKSAGIRLEFCRNCGRALLAAAGQVAALTRVRDLFRFTREETITELGDGQFKVDFRVALDFRLPLLRSIERTVKLVSSADLYTKARYIDQYVVAAIARETGKPEWIPADDLRKELSALRKAAVVAREVPNLTRFVDWDICIYNYIELNSREGFRARVVRKIPITDPDESSVSLT
jgi:hypothetical protein